MASSLKNLSSYNHHELPDATALSFGVVVADWNSEITFELLRGCCETLEKEGVKPENIHVQHVPGSFELPFGGQLLADTKKVDGVICLGCVITGETKHDEYISDAVTKALMQLSLGYKKPFVLGVITPRNEKQAKDRAGGQHGNKGVEAAITAIKMAGLKKASQPSKNLGFK